jgi:hypothetical protein
VTWELIKKAKAVISSKNFMIDAPQVIADLIHLLSYVVLIKQIIYNKSVHGNAK